MDGCYALGDRHRRDVRHRDIPGPSRHAVPGRRAGVTEHHAAPHGGLRDPVVRGVAARAHRPLGGAGLYHAALGDSGGKPVPEGAADGEAWARGDHGHPRPDRSVQPGRIRLG